MTLYVLMGLCALAMGVTGVALIFYLWVTRSGPKPPHPRPPTAEEELQQAIQRVIDERVEEEMGAMALLLEDAYDDW